MPWNYIATTKQLHNKKRHLTFILWLLILSRHRSFFHCFHNNEMYIKLWIWTCMFYNRLIKWSLSQFNCWYITERDAITAMCRIWCSHTRIGPVFVITLEFGLFSGECYHFRKHESFNRNFNRPILTYVFVRFTDIPPEFEFMYRYSENKMTFVWFPKSDIHSFCLVLSSFIHRKKNRLQNRVKIKNSKILRKLWVCSYNYKEKYSN